MAHDVYRLNVDYTYAQQVTPALDTGKVAFVPYVQFYAGGTAFDVNITGPLGTQAIAASVAVTPATSSSWAITAAQLPASVGGKAPAASLSVTPAVLSCATVAAGSTTTAFGATGAAGDYLSHVILEPAATNAGTTTIFNNATEVYKYTAGTLADLKPIIIPINMNSSGGAWKVTTGASMQARGFGTFTA